ncbi:MAG: Atg14 domain-containing protein [Syntrophorhabdaceae bacterium]|nr:Atg14 domain-containing protein [Syntrophorhabdaceae bacterium]
MEWDIIIEKIRDIVVGEVKEELRDFKSSVLGQLQGFTLAIESMNSRMSGMESRMSAIESDIRELRRANDETNKRIDDLRVELKQEIMLNTQRIDETNKRIDDLYTEVSYIRGDLNRALSQKEIIDDVLIRVQRLEDKVLKAA